MGCQDSNLTQKFQQTAFHDVRMHSLEVPLLDPGFLSLNQCHPTFGDAENLGQILSAEFVRCPAYRRRGQPDSQEITFDFDQFRTAGPGQNLNSELNSILHRLKAAQRRHPAVYWNRSWPSEAVELRFAPTFRQFLRLQSAPLPGPVASYGCPAEPGDRSQMPASDL